MEKVLADKFFIVMCVVIFFIIYFVIKRNKQDIKYNLSVLQASFITWFISIALIVCYRIFFE